MQYETEIKTLSLGINTIQRQLEETTQQIATLSQRLEQVIITISEQKVETHKNILENRAIATEAKNLAERVHTLVMDRDDNIITKETLPHFLEDWHKTHAKEIRNIVAWTVSTITGIFFVIFSTIQWIEKIF